MYSSSVPSAVISSPVLRNNFLLKFGYFKLMVSHALPTHFVLKTRLSLQFYVLTCIDHLILLLCTFLNATVEFLVLRCFIQQNQA